MESLLRACQSGKKQDVINFRKKLRDGCKVSYLSNVSVTQSDMDDWMVLPLVVEKEEILHKFDALPVPAKDQRSPELVEPGIDTRSDVECDSMFTTASSAFAEYGREEKKEEMERGEKRKKKEVKKEFELKKEIKKEVASPSHHNDLAPLSDYFIKSTGSLQLNPFETAPQPTIETPPTVTIREITIEPAAIDEY